MNDDLKFNLTEADIAEFEAALDKLTDTERHILFRLIELHPIGGVLDIMACMEHGDATSENHFPELDPYAKCVSGSKLQNQNVQISKDGRIYVKNPSARWVPEMTLHRQIGGTVYTVSGSYLGSEILDKKLLRVMVQNAENMEDSE